MSAPGAYALWRGMQSGGHRRLFAEIACKTDPFDAAIARGETDDSLPTGVATPVVDQKDLPAIRFGFL